jgi:signal peptidase I
VVVALAIGLVVAARTWVITPYEVAGDSMAPTLEVGRTVYVDQVSKYWDDVDRQDLITFNGPDGLMLKRVMAVGGDTIEMFDSVVIVNGEPLEEPYVDERTLDGVFFHTEVVPPGHVFVMGDNRFDSIDSRSFGPVAESDIVGKILKP